MNSSTSASGTLCNELNRDLQSRSSRLVIPEITSICNEVSVLWDNYDITFTSHLLEQGTTITNQLCLIEITNMLSDLPLSSSKTYMYSTLLIHLNLTIQPILWHGLLIPLAPVGIQTGHTQLRSMSPFSCQGLPIVINLIQFDTSISILI